MYQAYKQFADGMSQTKYSMWATIVGNIANVVINYFLIYGIWIFPKLGIIGAAIGFMVAALYTYLRGFKRQDIEKETS